MRFRTTLSSYQANWQIDHSSSVCLLGSCFATSIGEKFAKAKIKTLSNPWGTIYHPTPLLSLVKSAINNDPPNKNGYVKSNGRILHYGTHSDIHAHTQLEFVERFTSVNVHFIAHIRQSQCLFITLGTAWHFYHTDLDLVVSNCHKQPNNQFERRISSTNALEADIGEIVNLLQKINPSLQIILTVSPVRHERDGLIANNRSKAHLIAACHEICESWDSVHYFPAYELLIDDLRDYRYYDDDLVHPSSQAVHYIWQYLVKHHTLPTTQDLISSAERISKDLSHRTIQPESEQHRTFLLKLIDKMNKLQENGLDYEEEISMIKLRLGNLST